MPPSSSPKRVFCGRVKLELHEIKKQSSAPDFSELRRCTGYEQAMKGIHRAILGDDICYDNAMDNIWTRASSTPHLAIIPRMVDVQVFEFVDPYTLVFRVLDAQEAGVTLELAVNQADIEFLMTPLVKEMHEILKTTTAKQALETLKHRCALHRARAAASSAVLMRVFEKFDKNKNGVISLREFKLALGTKKIKGNVLASFVQRNDTNFDQSISLEEFTQSIHALLDRNQAKAECLQLLLSGGKIPRRELIIKWILQNMKIESSQERYCLKLFHSRDETLQTASATHIQACWRGRCARAKVAALQTQRQVESGKVAANILRGHVAAKCIRNDPNNAAIVIQCCFRSFIARKKRRLLCHHIEENAAIVVQCAFRSWRARRDSKRLYHIRRREYAEKTNTAAVLCQKRFRGYTDKKAFKQVMQKRNDAATQIASHVRRKTAQQRVQNIRKQKKERKAAAAIIQAASRGHRDRKTIREKKSENAAREWLESLGKQSSIKEKKQEMLVQTKQLNNEDNIEAMQNLLSNIWKNGMLKNLYVSSNRKFRMRSKLADQSNDEVDCICHVAQRVDPYALSVRVKMLQPPRCESTILVTETDLEYLFLQLRKQTCTSDVEDTLASYFGGVGQKPHTPNSRDTIEWLLSKIEFCIEFSDITKHNRSTAEMKRLTAARLKLTGVPEGRTSSSTWKSMTLESFLAARTLLTGRTSAEEKERELHVLRERVAMLEMRLSWEGTPLTFPLRPANVKPKV